MPAPAETLLHTEPDQTDRNPIADWFTLSWYIFPSPQDWVNWEAAGKPRLMVQLGMLRNKAGADLIRELRDRGVTNLVIQIMQTDIDNSSPMTLRNDCLAPVNAGIMVDAVILGKEPDTGLKWTYRKPGEPKYDWGQNYGYRHSAIIRQTVYTFRGKAADGVTDLLDDLGRPIGRYPASLVAPGWTCRNIWEGAEPQPGLITFRDICRDAYWTTDGFGLHSYTAYDNSDERIRHIKRLQYFLELFHMGPAFIDEFGILIGSDLDRYRFYIRIADYIYHHPVYGRMVRMFCPFTANGEPYYRTPTGEIERNPDGSPRIHWDPRYLINSPEPYRILGRYLIEGVIP